MPRSTTDTPPRGYPLPVCGRDSFTATWAEVRAFSQPLPLITPAEDPAPNHNRAPTQEGWAIVRAEAGGTALPMRWGLLPAWASDTRLAHRMINARLETVAQKPAFRDAWRQRRYLVPSSGYYEWRRLDGRTRQPYFIHRGDVPVLFFAGLWEARPDETGERLTYSIITRGADPTLAAIHDRMPLVLPATTFGDWLHGSPDDAMVIARSVVAPPLAFHRVDPAVGNVRNTGPLLSAPLAGNDSLF